MQRIAVIKYLVLLVLFAQPIPAAAQTLTQDQAAPMSVDQFKLLLPPAQEKETGLAELEEMLRDGSVTVLDVRSPEAFRRWHLKDAVNIPVTELTEKTLAAALPDKDRIVAVFCDYSLYPTRMVPMTMQAYPVLSAAGYADIRRLNLWSVAGGEMLTPEEIEKRLDIVKAE